MNKTRLIVLTLAALMLLSALPLHADSHSKQILMVVTSHDQMGDTDKQTGLWLSEVTHPYYEFVDHGYTVEFASPQGGEPPVDPRSRDQGDSLNVRFLADKSAQKNFNNSIKISEVDAGNYDAIFFAGGHGTMWDFPESDEVADLTAEMYESGGTVGAVCHGPAALVNVKLTDGSYLLKGKKVTGFTNEEEEAVGLTETVPFLLQTKLSERGAEFVPAEKWSENVVASGRLVTGQNPASASGVARQIIEILESDK